MKHWLLAIAMLLFTSHTFAQKACSGQYGPIVGCTSDSRHFPCYTSPDTMVKAMCPGGEGTASQLGKPRSGNKCGYHYFQISCAQRSTLPAPTRTQAPADRPYSVSGRIRCLENGSYPSFEITVDSNASGESCTIARQAVDNYFRQQDRCRNSPSGIYPNRSWDGKKIEWLQTNTCR